MPKPREMDPIAVAAMRRNGDWERRVVAILRVFGLRCQWFEDISGSGLLYALTGCWAMNAVATIEQFRGYASDFETFQGTGN